MERWVHTYRLNVGCQIGPVQPNASPNLVHLVYILRYWW